MTWSIVAKDPESGLYGIAIASRFFAVGFLCPSAAGGLGAVCSQALMNPAYGPRGLALLREGLAAADVVETLISADQGRDSRQVHVVDSMGRTAVHTGRSCIDWCGSRNENNLSVAGNMLAGEGVVADTFAAYKAASDEPFVERLLAAMDAGEAAGGDKRGKQSAAILIQGEEPYPRLSLRVDDHTDPLVELRRLYEVAKGYFIPFSAAYPRPERPHGITDRRVLDALIDREAGKPLSRVDLTPPA